REEVAELFAVGELREVGRAAADEDEAVHVAAVTVEEHRLEALDLAGSDLLGPETHRHPERLERLALSAPLRSSPPDEENAVSRHLPPPTFNPTRIRWFIKARYGPRSRLHRRLSLRPGRRVLRRDPGRRPRQEPGRRAHAHLAGAAAHPRSTRRSAHPP